MGTQEYQCISTALTTTELTLFTFSGKQSLSIAYHLVFVWNVAMYLLEYPLRGRLTSVHNQRIKRMRKDVYVGITGFYY